MRMKMHGAASMNAAANAVEASFCSCANTTNTGLLLDAMIMASIIISLLSLAGLISIISLLVLAGLLALILVHPSKVRLKDLRPIFA